MALGGVLGIWFGGVIAEAYGWRRAFIWMGVPGLLLAALASRLREIDRKPPPPVADTLRQWWRQGMHGVTPYAMPLATCAGAGAVLAGLRALFEGTHSQYDTAAFSGGVTAAAAGPVWTRVR